VNAGKDTESFLIKNPDYTPILFEPNPMFSDRLDKLAKKYGGQFYKRAVWIQDDQVLTFKQNRNIFKNGVGASMYELNVNSIGKTRYVKTGTNKFDYGRFDDGSSPDSFQVNTLDLSNFIKHNFKQDDVITLRLDVEGAEYEILRKFIIDGVLCYFDRIEYEAHAFFSVENRKFKVFDAVFPWIASACVKEVEVEAIHLAGLEYMENIFDFSGLSRCDKCALKPIDGGPASISQSKPGWWFYSQGDR